MDRELGETNGLSGPHQQHSNTRYDEQGSSSGSFAKGWRNEGDNKVPDLKDTVDKKLGACTTNAELVENLVLVVTDKTVSGPLGEESESDNNSYSTEIASRSEEAEVANLSRLTIQFECSFNFFNLITY